MKKFFTKLLLAACMLPLFAIEAKAQEVDSLFMDSTINFTVKQMLDSCFKHVDLQQVPTGILLEKALVTADVKAFNGDAENDSAQCNAYLWRRLYGSLMRAHIDTAIANDTLTLHQLVDTINGYLNTGIVPVVLLNYNYAFIKEQAFDDSLLYMDGLEMHDVSGRTESPYEVSKCIAAAPGFDETDSLEVHFMFPSHLYLSNDTATIDTLQVDFGDGLGYRTINFDEEVIILYDTTAEVEMKVRLHFTNNPSKVINSKLLIKIKQSQQYDYYIEINGTKTYNGGTGKALVSVHYSCNNPDGKLRRPLIVASGYGEPYNDYGNPGHKGPAHGGVYLGAIEEYSLETYDRMLAQEYDLVVVDYLTRSTYLQYNAYAFKEVINWVNEQKALNGSKAQNVIIGGSMGGLVARFALGDMHQDHLANPTTVPDHDTRIFYTHDSPHRGVNMPLGHQAMIKTLTDYYIVLNKLPIVEWYDLFWDYENLNSKAGQQMLINNILDPIAPNAHSAFYDELNTIAPLDGLGCKAVLICDGSGAGVPQGVGTYVDETSDLPQWNETKAGSILLHCDKKLSSSKRLNFVSYATPNQNSSFIKVFEAAFVHAINYQVIHPYYVNSKVPYVLRNGLDGAPGSLVDEVHGAHMLGKRVIGGLGNAIPYAYRLVPKCFIPSISAMAADPSVTDDPVTGFINFRTPVNGLNVSQAKRFLTYDENVTSPTINPRNWYHVEYTTNSAAIFDYEMLYMVPETLPTSSWFNYRAPVSDRIGTTLIQDGATLHIHANQDAGLSSSIRYDEAPLQGSFYRVETMQFSYCNSLANSIVTVEGELILGDNSGSLSGELVIRTGSKLKLENNSLLKLYQNSKLIVQEGAELVVDGDVNIELEGESSEVIVRGKLTLKDNTTLNVTGAGSIHFDCPENAYCNTDISPGSIINLIGNGRSVKMLKVTSKGIDLTDLEELNITTAKVELGTNSEVVIGGSLELNAVRVSKTSGTAGNHIHKGFEINSPTGKTIAIDNCIFEYGIKGLTKTASSSLTQLVIENTTFTNCSLGLKTNECRCNLVNVRFDNCVTGWKAEAMSGSSDFRGYVQSVDNGIDYEGGSTAHLFIYESTFKTCNNSNTAQAILADGDFNATISCTHFEDNDNDIKKIDGVLNLSGSEYSENRFASSPEVGGSCYFNNTLRYTIDLSNVDFYIYDGNNDFDYPDVSTSSPPNNIFKGTIISNTTTLALGGNHWEFSQYTPNQDDLPPPPSQLFNITSITATPPYSTATKLSSPSNCLSAWNGVQEYVERIHKPGKSALNKEISSYTIYPNPAANQLFIKVSNGSLSANQRVKAIDMMGRTITLHAHSQDSSTQSYDISQLAVGMYQIIVEQNGHILHKQKLVVSR